MSTETVTVQITDEVTVVATAATGLRGPTGAPGADGADAVYSDATPAALGTAAPGTADLAAREGHVHPMPTPGEVGADPAGTAAGLVAAYEPNIPHIEMTVSQPGGPGTEWRFIVPTPLRSAVFVPPFLPGDEPTGTFDGVEVSAPTGTDDPRWWLVAPVSGNGSEGVYLYDPTDHGTVTGFYGDQGAGTSSTIGVAVGLAVVPFAAVVTDGGAVWVGGATADSVVFASLADVARSGDYSDLTGAPTIPSTPGDVGADPAGTAAGRTLVGSLAARPSAAALSDGVRYLATDDAGGTIWVVSSSTWVQAGASVIGGNDTLALTELGASEVVTVSVTNTDYRVTGLTASFTVPTGRRVAIDVGGGLRVYKSGDADISPAVSIRWSANSWASSSALTTIYGPMWVGSLFGIELNDMPQLKATLPASVAAGSTVAVAVFVRDTVDTGDHTIGFDSTNGLRPYILATALS